MPLLLPQKPSIEELKEIEDYVNFHRKIKDEEEGIYQDKEQLREGLIIFKHQKKKVKNWYLRMYIGNRKYKTTSLKTQNYRQAKEIAFDEYDKLSQTLRDKGSVFEKTNEEYLQDYLDFLDKELEKKNNITSKKTIDAKKTSLKKLKTLLLPYLKPSNINPDFLEDYLLWRRKINVEGGNWNKKHKNNIPKDKDLVKNDPDQVMTLCDAGYPSYSAMNYEPDQLLMTYESKAPPVAPPPEPDIDTAETRSIPKAGD